MTDEQFEKLMAKLAEIERQIKTPGSEWDRLFNRPLLPQPQWDTAPSFPRWPQVTD